jgi:hypothetical protein
MPDDKPGKGRPTKYDPKYCDKLIEFFSGERYKEVQIVTTGKNDYEKIETKQVANELPTFEQFAHQIDVNGDTLVEWSKVHEDFSAAYTHAKELQKNFLIQNGMLGLYNPAFTIFVAKNITDMKDMYENEHSGKVTFTNLFSDASPGKNATDALLQSGEGS